MIGTYNTWLVIVSVVISILASFVALDLASRVVASHSLSAKRSWLIGGAISLGTGIWSTHFIGMLAFLLPIQISYDVPITLASLLIAILASLFVFYWLSRDVLTLRRLIVGGVLMGIGIFSMHHMGIVAMRMDPPIRYQPILISLSVCIAMAGSAVAIWSAFVFRLETILSAVWKKIGSALVMGIAISGMHYTGMAAAVFAPDSICKVNPQYINTVWLAATIGGFVMMLLLLTMLLSAFDAYFTVQLAKYAQAQLRLKSRLETQTAELTQANTALKQEVQARIQAEEGLRQAQAVLETRVAERTADLARTNTQLQELSRRLVEIRESERKELSRELHDRMGQKLTALAINLNLMKTRLSGEVDKDLRSKVEDSISIVQSTSDAVENVMAELRPPMLDDYGLLPALHWYAEEFSKRTGISVVITGDAPQVRPAPEAEIALFRIVQEALNNVAKHARAMQVKIGLEHQGNECILSISDDGIGLGRTQAAMARHWPGLGMVTMKERAHAVGGNLDVRAAPGHGTKIVVRMPC
jgi:NO-binding membrane sensor protein with MHYT domain/two-component sensor histidine kinase